MGNRARRLQVILHEHGVPGVIRHFFSALGRRFDPQWRRRMRERVVKERADRDFDLRYGVNTWGDTPLHLLGIEQQDLSRGNGLYRPVSEELFQEAMSLLQIDPSHFNFIDYGSGKGKALLMASHLPFKRIIGIEFSPILHDAAVANLGSFHSPDQRCSEISALCHDAMEYCPPAGPLVCFFFNPFSREVWLKVLEKLRSLWESHPHPLFIVYANQRTVDELGTVLSDCEFLEAHALRPRVLVYRARNRRPDTQLAAST